MSKLTKVQKMTIRKQKDFRKCYNSLDCILMQEHQLDLTFEELDDIIDASIETIRNLSVLNDRKTR